MSQKYSSFFDSVDANEQPSLWTEERAILNKVLNPVIFAGNLYKYSKKSLKYKERYFVLSNGRLYCLRNAKADKYIGYISIKFATFAVDRELLDGEVVYIVRFVRDNKCAKLMLKDKQKVEELKDALKPYVIQTNFNHVYEAKKVIGKGAFASVYLCVHKRTGEQVAVKRLSKKKSMKTKDGRQLTMNEIEISASLDNPHLMKMFEVFESSTSIYIVYELMEGGDLISYLKTKEFISHEDIYTIVRSLLKGLLFLQMNGIIHRDIKPHNVMLSRRGESGLNHLKIVDFGLSTQAQVDSYIVSRCGTPGYMAPEVIKYEAGVSPKLSFKCDVFSVGVILYYIITGQRPFIADKIVNVIRLNRECKIDFTDSRFDELPHLRDLIQLMLDPNPVTRICARDALNHPFFDVYTGSTDDFKNYDSFRFPCNVEEPVSDDKKYEDAKVRMTEGLMNGYKAVNDSYSVGSVRLSESTNESAE